MGPSKNKTRDSLGEDRLEWTYPWPGKPKDEFRGFVKLQKGVVSETSWSLLTEQDRALDLYRVKNGMTVQELEEIIHDLEKSAEAKDSYTVRWQRAVSGKKYIAWAEIKDGKIINTGHHLPDAK